MAPLRTAGRVEVHDPDDQASASTCRRAEAAAPRSEPLGDDAEAMRSGRGDRQALRPATVIDDPHPRFSPLIKTTLVEPRVAPGPP